MNRRPPSPACRSLRSRAQTQRSTSFSSFEPHREVGAHVQDGPAGAVVPDVVGGAAFEGDSGRQDRQLRMGVEAQVAGQYGAEIPQNDAGAEGQDVAIRVHVVGHAGLGRDRGALVDIAGSDRHLQIAGQLESILDPDLGHDAIGKSRILDARGLRIRRELDDARRHLHVERGARSAHGALEARPLHPFEVDVDRQLVDRSVTLTDHDLPRDERVHGVRVQGVACGHLDQGGVHRARQLGVDVELDGGLVAVDRREMQALVGPDRDSELGVTLGGQIGVDLVAKLRVVFGPVAGRQHRRAADAEGAAGGRQVGDAAADAEPIEGTDGDVRGDVNELRAIVVEHPTRIVLARGPGARQAVVRQKGRDAEGEGQKTDASGCDQPPDDAAHGIDLAVPTVHLEGVRHVGVTRGDIEPARQRQPRWIVVVGREIPDVRRHRAAHGGGSRPEPEGVCGARAGGAGEAHAEREGDEAARHQNLTPSAMPVLMTWPPVSTWGAPGLSLATLAFFWWVRANRN